MVVAGGLVVVAGAAVVVVGGLVVVDVVWVTVVLLHPEIKTTTRVATSMRAIIIANDFFSTDNLLSITLIMSYHLIRCSDIIQIK